MTDSNQLSSPARLRARSQAADERANGQLSKEERRRLAAESWDLGWDCAQVEEYELSEANFLRVQTLYRDLSAGGEEARDPMNLVAASLNYIGLLYLGRDRRDESIDWFDQAIAIRRDLQRVNSDDRENQVYLGGALCNRGTLLRKATGAKPPNSINVAWTSFNSRSEPASAAIGMKLATPGGVNKSKRSPQQSVTAPLHGSVQLRTLSTMRWLDWQVSHQSSTLSQSAC